MKKQIMVWLMILSVLSVVNLGWAVIHEDGHTVGEPRDTLKVLPIPGYTGRYRPNGVPEVNGPPQGEQKCLVILVKFPDEKNSFWRNPGYFQKLLFDTSNDKSMAKYYEEVSYGKINVTGAVAGNRWLTSAQNYVYYGGEDDGDPEHGDIDKFYDNDGDGQIKDDAQGNPPDLPPEFNGRYSYVGVLAKEALALADPYVDYSVYDTNGDKHITPDELHLIIIHAGRDQAQFLGKETDIWSHHYVTPGWQEHDGVNLTYYIMGAETSQMGTFAHEFGHDLGLPDLYDTTGASEGIGNWGLMGAGSHLGGGKTPAHLCAWSKAQLGWIAPTEITSNLTQLIDQVETKPIVYKLWKNGNYNGTEYFLIENRQKVGFDAKLPGAGLLIWHIDDSQPNNDSVNHKLVDLEEADETESHDSDLDHNRNRGDDGDPWPGTTVDRFFNDTSFPNSKDYSSNPTFVAVENISNSGTVMTAELRVSPPGGWPSDPTVNVPVSAAAGDQGLPQLVTDGDGGAIIAWYDSFSDKGDLYVQRVNSSGSVQWTTNGILISTLVNSQRPPQLVSDGMDGAIITWMDYRSSIWDIYAQRVDANGIVRWAPNGVPICTAAGEQWFPQLVSDGTGGAIITWADVRSSVYDANIYAQRVNASGTVLWTTNGVPICTAANHQSDPTLISDGVGGAIIT